MTGVHADVWGAPLCSAALLAAGVYATAVIDAAAAARIAGARLEPTVVVEPLRRAAVLAVQQRAATERPDLAAWLLAPSLYVALAAAGLSVVPWSSTFAVADVRAGIVVWGTVESLVIVAIFLHGWSANAHQPLVAGYRFLAVGLSYLLLSMFVLIAAAIPAESLAVSDIVVAQRDLWNVVRQPLGFPLFVIVALGSATWGPLDLAGGADLAGGTTADVSGVPLLVWRAARAAMLTSFAAMAATVFLGGWQGPWLPQPVWVAVKTLLVLAVLVVAGHTVARTRAERFVTVCWVVLLPLGFVDLAMAGVEALR